MTSAVPSMYEAALEINTAYDRQLMQNRLLVVLLGPSAVGKSTIIQHLTADCDEISFEYVTPVITRPNRPGETDKLSVKDSVFDAMQKQGAFINVNNLYGVRYGTPIDSVLGPLKRGSVPITDFPLERVNVLQRPEYDLLNFYVMPGSIESWKARNAEAGRSESGRLASGVSELTMLERTGFSHPDIDVHVVNEQGRSREAARYILDVLNIATL